MSAAPAVDLADRFGDLADRTAQQASAFKVATRYVGNRHAEGAAVSAAQYATLLVQALDEDRAGGVALMAQWLHRQHPAHSLNPTITFDIDCRAYAARAVATGVTLTTAEARQVLTAPNSLRAASLAEAAADAETAAETARAALAAGPASPAEAAAFMHAARVAAEHAIAASLLRGLAQDRTSGLAAIADTLHLTQSADNGGLTGATHGITGSMLALDRTAHLLTDDECLLVLASA